MGAIYGFVNPTKTRKDADRGVLAVPGDGVSQVLQVDGIVAPFERASVIMEVDFDETYGAGPAGMTVSFDVSPDGTTWYDTTVHDRLSVPPDPLVDNADAVMGVQDIQAEAIVIDTDTKAEVAELINWFPYIRMEITSATIPCWVRAQLVAE